MSVNWKDVREFEQYLQRIRAATRTVESVHKRRGGVRRARRSPGGPYTGLFPEPQVLSLPNKYSTKGGMTKRTQSGYVNLSNVAYHGVQSLHIDDMFETLGVACLRYMMRKHYQIEYSSNTDPVYRAGVPSGTVNLDPYSLEFEYSGGNMNVPASGSSIVDLFNINANTVRTFGEAAKAVGLIFKQLFGNSTDYSKISRYRFNHTNDTSTVQAKAWNSFDNVCVSLFSYASMCVQNCTPTDGGSVDTMASDVNPIRGRLFEFAGLLPSVRVDVNSTAVLTGGVIDPWQMDPSKGTEADRGNGLIYADIPPSTVNTSVVNRWSVVPSATEFDNCKAVSKVLLQPGHMKHLYVRFNWNGNLNKLLTTLNDHLYLSAGNVARAENYTKKPRIGSCMMLALEKTCRTGNAAFVKLNYHVRRTTGACCYSGRKKSVLYQPTQAIETVNVGTVPV